MRKGREQQEHLMMGSEEEKRNSNDSVSVLVSMLVGVITNNKERRNKERVKCAVL